MRLAVSAVSIGIAGVFMAFAAPGHAGTVAGKLELPPAPERGPVIAKGFLDRVENPLADIKKPSIAPYLVVVLEGEARSGGAPAEVRWNLVGESFERPVVAVPVGAEVVIKNLTRVSRAINAVEDPTLIVAPLNPTGSKSFRPDKPAVYTIADRDAPHLRGKVVVVPSLYVAGVDDAGRFEIADVPDGTYRLRIFYYDRAGEAQGRASDWLPTTAEVTVAHKGKPGRTEVTVKLPAELATAPRSASPPPPAPASPPGSSSGSSSAGKD